MGAVGQSLACQLTGANSDLRLDDVVARVEGEFFGVDEHTHALYLVVGDSERPDEREDGHEQRRHHQQVAAAHAGHDHHAEPDCEEDEARPEVRFDEHQTGHRRDDHQREDQRLQVLGVAAVLTEKAGEREDGGQLGKLGRLDLDRPKVEPARRTERRLANDEDRHERHQPREVEKPRIVRQVVIVDLRNDEHHPQTDGGEDDLLGHRVGETRRRAVVRARRTAVDQQQPHCHQPKGREHDPVVEPVPAPEHAGPRRGVGRSAPAAVGRNATQCFTFSSKYLIILPATGAALSPPTPRSK